MRVLSLCVLCLVGLSASFCSASVVDETNSVLRLDDLTPEARSAVVGLATSISGANASQATIDDNVAAILSVLQQFSFSTGAASFLRVLPFANINGNTMAAWLANLLGENVSANVYPSQSASYLYMIQRALYGSSGVPSPPQAILPILSRIESALTNNQSSVDMGWTNLLVSPSGESYLDYPWYVAEAIRWSGLNWYEVAEFFSSAQGLPGTWQNLWNAVYQGQIDIHDVWEEDATEASATDSALRVVDANVLSALYQLELTAEGISYEVYQIANRGPQVVVISNLQELIRHIDQVTNYQATASDEYQAAQYSSAIADEERAGQEAFSDQMDYDLQETSNTLAHSEPDYEVHYTDNPMSPLATAVDFTQTMRQQMPDVSSIDTKSRIYLFKTDWDEEGLLSRRGLREISVDLSGSDPHVPNQFYNYCERIMSWAWNLAALVTAFALFRDFWNWVASWRA